MIASTVARRCLRWMDMQDRIDALHINMMVWLCLLSMEACVALHCVHKQQQGWHPFCSPKALEDHATLVLQCLDVSSRLIIILSTMLMTIIEVLASCALLW